jgi:hypothetical protein
MRKYRFQLAFGAGCGIALVLLTRFFGSDSLAGSSLDIPSALSTFVGFVNIIPYSLSAILSGGDFGDARGEFAYWALIFAQWTGIGTGISALVSWPRSHDVKA